MHKPHSHRTRDPENAERFFSEHHDLLLSCAQYQPKGAAHLSPEGKKLVRLARSHFGYSANTASVDIMISLLKHFRRRVRGSGQGKAER